jgi:uncharacterized protein
MMIIRVSDIPEEGLQVEDRAAFRFADATWRLDSVSLAVTRDGDDVDVVGRIDATVPQTCGRCLEEYPATVQAAVDVRFAPRPAASHNAELGRDDLDVDFYDNDELDLGALVENETTLALPMKPLCREDCRGLCPVCGSNRNLGACACPARTPDPRLAVLKDLAARLK